MALGSLGDASAASLGLHFVVLAFFGLEVRAPKLVGVDLVDDPAPEDVRVTPPRAIPTLPEPEPEPGLVPDAPRDARVEPPPPEPLPAERSSLVFLRSDGLADAEHVESAFLSDRDARAIREGRSLATLEAAPLASEPGLLPSPEAGMGPTHSDSKALRLFNDGERDHGEDRPPPGAPAPNIGAPASGALETHGASERSVAQDALDPLDAALRRELAGATDPSSGDFAVGAGTDFQIAAAREVRDAREQNETDGTNASPEGTARGDAIADADLLGKPDEMDAPEGGGADGIGKTGVDSDRSPARDGAPGRHTLPGEPGAPSQLQAAPMDLPIDVGAMLSVRGNPLGPWLVLLDTALRERWKPPPDLRMGEATTIVSFTVSRQGRVTDIELDRGSGRSALDALAIASIPARVPAPSGIEGDTLRVRYSFRTGP